MIAAATLELSASNSMDPVIKRVVEELWQKGYDLQQSGAEWVVREPLGSKAVRLASDNDLIGYAAGRTRCIPPQMLSVAKPDNRVALSEPERVPDHHSSPPADAPAPFLEIKVQDDQDALTWASWFPGKYASKWVLSCFIIGGLLVIKSIFSAGYFSPSVEEHPAVTVPIEVKADTHKNAVAPQNPPQKTWAVVDTGNYSGSATASTLNSGGRVSVTEDVSTASQLCVAQLQERFSARAPVLIPSSQSLPGEICYSIEGSDYCPYHSRGQAVFLYVDSLEASAKTYGCDVNVGNMTISNVRVVKADPGIVKFLVSESSFLR